MAIGREMPRMGWKPSSRQSKNPAINRYAAALMTTESGAARDCRRAAMFGVTPTADAG
jgi:hypothetical protein